jgi:hypothetical protein
MKPCEVGQRVERSPKTSGRWEARDDGFVSWTYNLGAEVTVAGVLHVRGHEGDEEGHTEAPEGSHAQHLLAVTRRGRLGGDDPDERGLDAERELPQEDERDGRLLGRFRRVMMAMMMRVVAQKTEVQMRMGRRPNMSGRK